MCKVEEKWDNDVSGPCLVEEVDEQLWMINQFLTKPQGEIRNSSSKTCLRICGLLASCWSDRDYEEISFSKHIYPMENVKTLAKNVVKVFSEPISKTTYDMWALRGDRMIEIPTNVVTIGLDDINRKANEIVMALKKPSAVTDTEEYEGEEDQKPEKPLVWKKPEPPPDRRKDEWGFPAPESEEESVSHYESVEPALRDDAIKEFGMKTRVQLTTYFCGKYIKGEADNFYIPDIKAELVREVLEPIETTAKHLRDVAGETRKGGRRIRIQLTNNTDKKNKYIKQDGSEGSLDLSIPGMTVAQVSLLVDYQLAIHFGIRRGKAEVLVKNWKAFIDSNPKIEDSFIGLEELVCVPEVKKDQTLEISHPSLLGKFYNKNLHSGFFCVVSDNLQVINLWNSEEDAIKGAKRIGARVVDSKGFLIPKNEMKIISHEMRI